MSEFAKLINEVSDQRNRALSDVLLKAKVLASRLRSRKFRQWIDSELNGYGKGQSLPDYRIVGSSIEGYFGGYRVLNGVPISTSHLDPELRNAFEKQYMPQAVAFIESIVKRGDDDIGLWMDGWAVNHLRKHGMQIDHAILNSLLKRTSLQSLEALLSCARSRLLDLLLELRDRFPELEENDAATSKVSESEVDAAMGRIYNQCTVIEDSEMRDSYQAGQAGAMGPGAHADNMQFIQILREAIGSKSLGELAGELEKVRQAMLAEAKSVEQDAAVAAVADAETASKKGDARGVLGSLKAAGTWALDVATKLGTSVAASAITKALTGQPY